MDVLFVAINPAPSVAQHGPFASPTNGFWELLHRSNLTPVRLLPTEASRLRHFGLGLTSLVRRATPKASDLSADERRRGVVALRRTVRRLRPKMLAPLGLTLLPLLLPDEERPGPGKRVELFEGIPVFVLPNPSGRNRSYPGIVGKLPWYRALSVLVRR